MRRSKPPRVIATIILAGLCAAAVTSCAIVDSVGLRTNTLNESIADYNGYSILLNIVRASEAEPLNFVAVTQGSPNTSYQGNAAVPTFNLSPYALTTYSTPGNSVQATASDALTVQPVDDPGSWQALLTPIDVGTMGFFVKQGYPMEILSWLFIDRIRIVSGPGRYEELVNDPDDPSFYRFTTLLPNLIVDGFTVEIDRAPPKSGQSPTSRICFKRSVALNALQEASKLPLTTGETVPGAAPRILLPAGDDCSAWLAGEQNSAQADSSSKAAAPSSPVYVYLNPAKLPSPKPQKPPTGSAWYDFPAVIPQAVRAVAWPHQLIPAKLPKGSKLQFSTRSAYAVYLYLGRYLRENIQPKVTYTTDNDSLLTIVHDRTINCFAQLSYNREHYCVPDEAYNTKRTFAILHQLVGLNIVHTSTPAVLNVRNLP